MGRRKIEIQPITHERNRSVTFLKRKNGLFKKAYELAVLCSVDVAVIIFEERHGHQVKLYQYSSTDIHSIVERHTRYDGEVDSRGPTDFSGIVPSKGDDVADGDDDELDDGDNSPVRGAGSGKRTGNGKLKPDFASSSKSTIGHGDTETNVGYEPRRPVTIPPPPIPMHHSSGTPGSSHPISGERLSALSRGQMLPNPHKKQRTMSPNVDAHLTHAHQDEPYSYQNLPSSSSGPSFRSRHQQVPYHAFPDAFVPSPASLLGSSTFDFAQPTSSSPFQSLESQHTSAFVPAPSHAVLYPDHSPQGSYQQLVRQPQLSHLRHHQPAESQPPSKPSHDLFVAFLEAEALGQTSHEVPVSQAFVPLNWPVHSQGAGHHDSGSPQAVGSGVDDTNWLGFLSGGPSGTSMVTSVRRPLPSASGYGGPFNAPGSMPAHLVLTEQPQQVSSHTTEWQMEAGAEDQADGRGIEERISSSDGEGKGGNRVHGEVRAAEEDGVERGIGESPIIRETQDEARDEQGNRNSHVCIDGEVKVEADLCEDQDNTS